MATRSATSMVKLLLLVLQAIVIGGAAAAQTSRQCLQLRRALAFPYCLDLGVNGSLTLAWKADKDNIWLAIDLDDASAQWVGVGLSQAGGMKGADLAVVAKEPEGGLLVQDLWSERFGVPDMDASQDVVLVAPLASGQPQDHITPRLVSQRAAKLPAVPGHLRAVLRRPLHACDPQDLSVTPGLPQHIVWSYGEAPWPSYHGNTHRGDAIVNLLPLPGEALVTQPPAPGTPLPPGAATIDLTMPHITIPAAPTSYLCTHFKMPSDRKYHIIAQEPLVSPLVHHMILFACTTPPSPAVMGDVYPCARMESGCSSFTMGWAVGMKYLSFPNEAGFPFGATPEGEEPIPTWFALQVHYNNPNGEAPPGRDSSGMRITYTSALRPNDLGVITLTQQDLVLPPGQRSVLCPAACTAKLSRPLTMLYVALHMHALGATIQTRHIRGSQELAPLGQRRAWDFNHQEFAPIPFATRQLLPGDSLITQCTYNTLGQANTTRYGESTTDEMCYVFVMAWPRAPFLELCTSLPPGAPPGGNLTAVCAPNTDAPSAGSPIEDAMPGLQPWIVNATWPVFDPYQDPLCPAGSSNHEPTAQATLSAALP